MRGTTLLFLAAVFSANLIVPSRAAVTVTLDCSAPFANQAFPAKPGIHGMIDIDYDANTVRNYAIDDDGVVLTYSLDKTYPAQVTANEITWRDEYKGVVDVFTLGRITGILTMVLTDARNPSVDQTQRWQCKKSTAPTQAPQF